METIIHKYFWECQYTDKKVIRLVIDDFGSSSDHSDDSEEEYVKATRLMFFEKAILKMSSLRNLFWKNVFLREQFWKCIFWKCVLKMYFLLLEGEILKNTIFERAILKMYFLREQFWNVFLREKFF